MFTPIEMHMLLLFCQFQVYLNRIFSRLPYCSANVSASSILLLAFVDVNFSFFYIDFAAFCLHLSLSPSLFWEKHSIQLKKLLLKCVVVGVLSNEFPLFFRPHKFIYLLKIQYYMALRFIQNGPHQIQFQFLLTFTNLFFWSL